MEGPQSVGTGEREWDTGGWELGARGLTWVKGAVSDLELGFILVGNVFPCSQEHLPVCRVNGRDERWDPNNRGSSASHGSSGLVSSVPPGS